MEIGLDLHTSNFDLRLIKCIEFSILKINKTLSIVIHCLCLFINNVFEKRELETVN
jgi:hypothetical protein